MGTALWGDIYTKHIEDSLSAVLELSTTQLLAHS